MSSLDIMIDKYNNFLNFYQNITKFILKKLKENHNKIWNK